MAGGDARRDAPWTNGADGSNDPHRARWSGGSWSCGTTGFDRSRDPGEVLIRVVAAAVNNTDVWTRQGSYGLPGDAQALAGWRGHLRFSRVQGGDIAGTVAEVGPGVDIERVGERVVVDPALYRDHGRDAPPGGLLGSEADGGFAEYVTVSAVQAHDMTDSPLSDQQLAALPVAYGTAMGMVERAAITAVTSADKAGGVRAAGAEHTVDRSLDLTTQVEACCQKVSTHQRSENS